MTEVLAIEGVRRQFKQLADGTLAVTIHIEPRHIEHFMRLFSEIDMPVALAPLGVKRDEHR
jgi:hypothetical protein